MVTRNPFGVNPTDQAGVVWNKIISAFERLYHEQEIALEGLGKIITELHAKVVETTHEAQASSDPHP